MHKNEIDAIAQNDKKVEQKLDCGKTECKNLYGLTEGKPFWCKKCIQIFEMPKEKRPKMKKILKEKLCPECGKSTTSLKQHMDYVHRRGEYFVAKHAIDDWNSY